MFNIDLYGKLLELKRLNRYCRESKTTIAIENIEVFIDMLESEQTIFQKHVDERRQDIKECIRNVEREFGIGVY